MSPKTAAVIEEIKASTTDAIAPVTFSHFFGRAATSAAFRIAKARVIIELAYMSAAGTPVYRLAK